MGLRIRQERAGARLSQVDLAEQMSVTRLTIRNWEDGRTEIPATAIKRMCDLFGCTSDWLLGRSDTRRTA